MSAGHTRGPWYVLDQRETYMRSLGWPGPFNDAILISAKSPREILESSGENSVVARISFDNRPEKLGESNLADARLIAAAPDMFRALELALKYWADRQQRYRNRAPIWVQEARAAIAKAVLS